MLAGEFVAPGIWGTVHPPSREDNPANNFLIAGSDTGTRCSWRFRRRRAATLSPTGVPIASRNILDDEELLTTRSAPTLSRLGAPRITSMATFGTTRVRPLGIVEGMPGERRAS